MTACNTRETSSQLKLSTLNIITKRKTFTTALPLVTDPDHQQTMLGSKPDNTSTSLAWMCNLLLLNHKSLWERWQLTSTMNFSFLNFKTIFLNLDQDKEILEHSRNNSNIFKSNTNKFNSRNKELRPIASLKSARIDLRLTDWSESSMASSKKTITPKKSKSRLSSLSPWLREKLPKLQESWLDWDNNLVLMTKLTSILERRSLIKRDLSLNKRRSVTKPTKSSLLLESKALDWIESWILSTRESQFLELKSKIMTKEFKMFKDFWVPRKRPSLEPLWKSKSATKSSKNKNILLTSLMASLVTTSLKMNSTKTLNPNFSKPMSMNTFNQRTTN